MARVRGRVVDGVLELDADDFARVPFVNGANAEEIEVVIVESGFLDTARRVRWVVASDPDA